MFTGIIEKLGTISSVQRQMERLYLKIEVAGFTDGLKPGSSIAVDGVCLTATKLTDDGFEVDAVKETVDRTTLKQFRAGRKVNLEKAVRLEDRLDGHMVQGHVDGTGTLTNVRKAAGNVLLTFRLDRELIAGIVTKGSIAIDGISLTVVDVRGVNVTVTIVPFTLGHTTLQHRKPGDEVNIETDIIGKYVAKYMGNAGLR